MGNHIKHIIKYSHENGIELASPILWCGRQSKHFEWYFQDAQHAALALLNESRQYPCKQCRKAIIKVLEE